MPVIILMLIVQFISCFLCLVFTTFGRISASADAVDADAVDADVVVIGKALLYYFNAILGMRNDNSAKSNGTTPKTNSIRCVEEKGEEI